MRHEGANPNCMANGASIFHKALEAGRWDLGFLILRSGYDLNLMSSKYGKNGYEMIAEKFPDSAVFKHEMKE